MTEKEELEQIVKEAKEFWNEAAAELGTFGTTHIAMPMVNAMIMCAANRLEMLELEVGLAELAGIPAEEIGQHKFQQIRNIFSCLYYSGYTMGKREVPLLKVPCTHSDHEHGPN